MHQSNFSENIIAEAELIKFEFEKLQSRKYIEAITIDGANSRDLDDAISMEYHPDKFIVHISIADVSEYILPFSLLFNEALKRVSTQYLAHKNIPMLPEILSEDSLSLLELQKRLALTFTVTLSRDLEIVNTEINETILFNRRKLNYTQVDYILNSCPDDPDYQLLNDCYILARRLMDKRRKQGALVVFDLQRLIFTNEEGSLLRMTQDDAHKSNIIIQEFMILTNMAVAQIAAEKDFHFLYRNHTAKLNTPARDEILEQLQSSILNTRIFDSLVKRSGFWFNKAKYETILKGHYGLNLPVYTHITSPLRRVPDLINHILLKSQMWGKSLPFSCDEINNMASEINISIIDTRQEKKILYKEKSKQLIKEQISLFDIEKVSTCSSKELKTILKELSRSNNFPQGLEEALITRFRENQIGVEHIDIILFDTFESDDNWKILKNLALESAVKIPGFSLQLLYIKSQSGLLTDFKIEVIDNNGLFDSRIISCIKGKELSTAHYSSGKSKKEAQHAAANEFLKCYFSDQLVPASETERNENFSAETKINNLISEEDICDENYIGKLNELCINRSYSMPDFEFTQAGLAHAPVFNCHCKIQIGNKTKKTMASAGTKQNAKQFSAKKMLETFHDILDKIPDGNNTLFGKQESIPEIALNELINENYIGLLLEYCKYFMYPEPSYIYTQSGTQHHPIFTCTITLQTRNQLFTLTGAASSKKNAKQIASKNLLKQLEKQK